jgi:lipid II:glycine glycyltransferase (peptidoglycan interpeptide bridge formation enzyme)
METPNPFSKSSDRQTQTKQFFQTSRRAFRTMGVTNLSEIKNKIKRQQKFRSTKIEKVKAKLSERKQRAQAEKLDPKLKEVPAPSSRETN